METLTAERKGRFGFGSFLLLLVAIFGICLALYRFARGIGYVSNLNQGYPWGFWIGFDVLAGIALAAGGFVVAALVHVFGGEKYHPLVRPAILTAFLGYLVFIVALLVDLGRPWTLWHMIIYQQHESPMFEVGWCVMSYTFVLFLEFLPVVFERFNMAGLKKFWERVVPWVTIALLALFAIVLTRSRAWVILIAALLLIFQLGVVGGVFRRDRRVPTILIMAGVIFSTLHQSSLGTLFLMVPHKLSAIWYTPWLPVFFFVSAVMAGLAMVIVESSLSAKLFGHEVKLELLQGLGKGLSWVILIYLALRGIDLVVREAGTELLTTTPQAYAFWIETVVGLLIPLAILLTPEFVASRRGLYWASLMVVIGLVVNRLNVAVVGISAARAPTYYPHWMEIVITAGIVAAGILVYQFACRYFPVFEEHPKPAEA